MLDTTTEDAQQHHRQQRTNGQQIDENNRSDELRRISPSHHQHQKSSQQRMRNHNDDYHSPYGVPQLRSPTSEDDYIHSNKIHMYHGKPTHYYRDEAKHELLLSIKPHKEMMTNGDSRNGSPLHQRSLNEHHRDREMLMDERTVINKLFRDGRCVWPGCERMYSDKRDFVRHLDCNHVLDEKGAAQARVQGYVVRELEEKLTYERSKLAAMFSHLQYTNEKGSHMLHKTAYSISPPPRTPNAPPSSNGQVVLLPYPPAPHLHGLPHRTHMESNDRRHMDSPRYPVHPYPLRGIMKRESPGMSGELESRRSPHEDRHLPPSLLSVHGQPEDIHTTVSMHHKISSSDSYHPVRRRGEAAAMVDIGHELRTKGNLYQDPDVRPPYTYASLIRQGVLDSPNEELTLNEIYQWFMKNFAFFRKNTSTWKNAVRHNLSLHKCFVRKENHKGAVWTVDDVEFFRRRMTKPGLPKREYYTSNENNNEEAQSPPEPEDDYVTDEPLPSMAMDNMMRKGSSDNGDEVDDDISRDDVFSGPSPTKLKRFNENESESEPFVKIKEEYTGASKE